jgi:hypothetical protein
MYLMPWNEDHLYKRNSCFQTECRKWFSNKEINIKTEYLQKSCYFSIQAVVFWVMTIYSHVLTFWMNVLPPSSGLKCVGWGTTLVIQVEYKEGGYWDSRERERGNGAWPRPMGTVGTKISLSRGALSCLSEMWNGFVRKDSPFQDHCTFSQEGNFNTKNWNWEPVSGHLHLLSHQNPICIPLLPIRATCLVHIILLDFIILIILGKEYKL